jgi:LacI family transcriptional regulator
LPVGIRDIAEDLNLGLSTVAQALRGSGTISRHTRRLVVEHAAKLGYTPNRHAQRMRGRPTDAIGLIVPDVVLSPYVEVVQYLFHLVEGAGKELQIALTEFYDEMEDRAFKSMLASRVDGIIAKVGFARWEDVPEKHYLRRAKADGIPIVSFSNPIAGSNIPYLVHPMEQSVRLVVRHLIGLGHQRFGALLPAIRPFGPAMQNWLAFFREELAARAPSASLEIIGLPSGESGVEGPGGAFRNYVNQNHPKHAIPAGRQLFRQAMELAQRPTALVAYTDPVAVGAIFEAQMGSLRIGRDVAIAGCCQTPNSFSCPIALTSVDRRPNLYAQKLLDMLSAHLDAKAGAEKPMVDSVEPLLVMGESTIGR